MDSHLLPHFSENSGMNVFMVVQTNTNIHVMCNIGENYFWGHSMLSFVIGIVVQVVAD